MNPSDIALVGLLVIMSAGVGVACYGRSKIKSRLLKVCTTPVVGVVTNVDVLKDDLFDDLLDICDDCEKYKGKTLLSGYPYIRYEYNGKVYEKLYQVESMEIFTDYKLFGDGFSVPLLVNPRRPRQIVIDGVVAKDY